MNKLHLVSLLIIILFGACKEDEPMNPDPIDTHNSDIDNAVWISSEGQFQAGNATLEHYDREDKVVDLNIFSNANDRPLGDIFQSITFNNDIAYLIVNNSGTIERIDVETKEAMTPITGLTSPRYAVVHDEVIWVTDLFSGILTGVDINTLEVLHQIPVNGQTEEIVVLNDKIYFSAVNAGLIYELDPASAALSDSISVDGLPVHLKTDGEKLIVGAACCDWYWSDPGFIHSIDPESNEVEWTYSFSSGWPSELELSPEADRVYWLENGVRSLDLTFHTTPTIVINDADTYYYGLGVDPENGDIYLSDPADFTSASTVYRYSKTSELLDSFTTGVVTGDFYFPQ